MVWCRLGAWLSQTLFPFGLLHYSFKLPRGVCFATVGAYFSIYNRIGFYLSGNVRTQSWLDPLFIGWIRCNSTVSNGGNRRQSQGHFMDYGGACTAKIQAHWNLILYHSLRDAVQDRTMSVHYTPTTENKAYGLTKFLVRAIFEKFRAKVWFTPQDEVSSTRTILYWGCVSEILFPILISNLRLL